MTILFQRKRIANNRNGNWNSGPRNRRSLMQYNLTSYRKTCYFFIQNYNRQQFPTCANKNKTWHIQPKYVLHLAAPNPPLGIGCYLPIVLSIRRLYSTVIRDALIARIRVGPVDSPTNSPIGNAESGGDGSCFSKSTAVEHLN